MNDDGDSSKKLEKIKKYGFPFLIVIDIILRLILRLDQLKYALDLIKGKGIRVEQCVLFMCVTCIIVVFIREYLKTARKRNNTNGLKKYANDLEEQVNEFGARIKEDEQKIMDYYHNKAALEGEKKYLEKRNKDLEKRIKALERENKVLEEELRRHVGRGGQGGTNIIPINGKNKSST